MKWVEGLPIPWGNPPEVRWNPDNSHYFRVRFGAVALKSLQVVGFYFYTRVSNGYASAEMKRKNLHSLLLESESISLSETWPSVISFILETFLVRGAKCPVWAAAADWGNPSRAFPKRDVFWPKVFYYRWIENCSKVVDNVGTTFILWTKCYLCLLHGVFKNILIKSQSCKS